MNTGSNTPLTAIAVSTNAVNLMTGDAEGVVKLWDLRKTEGSIQTINLKQTGGPITRLKFDESGQYLGVTTERRAFIYNFESKTELVETVEPTGGFAGENGGGLPYTDIEFG